MYTLYFAISMLTRILPISFFCLHILQKTDNHSSPNGPLQTILKSSADYSKLWRCIISWSIAKWTDVSRRMRGSRIYIMCITYRYIIYTYICICVCNIYSFSYIVKPSIFNLMIFWHKPTSLVVTGCWTVLIRPKLKVILRFIAGNIDATCVGSI